MKFTTNLTEFVKCLHRVFPAIPIKQAPFELLEFFNLELKDNELTIIASDVDVTIKTTTIVEGREDGSVLVKAKRFLDFLKGLDPSKELIIENSEDNDLVLEIISGVTKFRFDCQDTDQYIELPELLKKEAPTKDTPDTIFFEKEAINKLTEKTAFAITDDSFRTNMTGVLFQFRDTYVNAVATDSFRLARYTHFANADSFPGQLDLLIPQKTVEILKRIDSDAIFSYDTQQEKPKKLRIDYGETIIISALIKETFPNYEAIIPTSTNYTTTFDISAFLDALKKVAIVTNPTNKRCELVFSTDTLKIITKNIEYGKQEVGTTEIPCELEGAEEFSVTFNSKHIEEMIGNITSNETNNNLISMYFVSPEKAALIKPKSDTDLILEILMPIRSGY